MKMSKGIFIRVPEEALPELREIKGKKSWLALLLDGVKYRGHELEIKTASRYRYDTHHYCTHCEKWHLHENIVKGIGRSPARCPDCFRRVRTRRPSSSLTAEEATK